MCEILQFRVQVVFTFIFLKSITAHFQRLFITGTIFIQTNHQTHSLHKCWETPLVCNAHSGVIFLHRAMNLNLFLKGLLEAMEVLLGK